MSKIKFEQIDESIVEIVISPETPIVEVQQLTKSLVSRGLVEDLENSTLSVRYFYRPEDKVNTVADQLIKSLQKLSKSDELPYWHPKSKIKNQARVREQAIAERRGKNGIKQPTNVSPAPEPHVMPDSSTGPKTITGGSNKLYNPSMSGTVNYKKSEDDEHVKGCKCDACLDMEKSNYGPKGAGQYNPVDNARRKMSNVGSVNVGPNSNVKAYSSKPGQLSGKAQSNLTARIQAAANKKQPVKRWSPEQIEAENVKRGLKKGWGQHLPFPSAEEEIMSLAKSNPIEAGETVAATQLASLMQSKAMLNPNHRQPSSEDLLMAGEQMGLGVSEEMAKAGETQWNGVINNWLVEAQKPISQRFASEEEELAYWNNIKVNDSGDRDPGY